MRIKRADLPPENSQAIFRRMQTEREREAKELRAQGAEVGQRIRARADRERRVLIAEAEREAADPRGQGDAEAIRIFAEAFGQDPEFFDFYRSLQAYRECAGRRRHQLRAVAGQRVLPVLQWPARSGAAAGRRAGPGAGPRGRSAAARPAAPAAAAAATPVGGGPRPAGLVAMRDLGTGLALVLVVEGVLWALFPEAHEAGRGAGGHARRRPLRLGGLAFAVVGVLLVWLIRR